MTTSTEFKGRVIYTTTTNDFRMHVNSRTTASFLFNSTTLVVHGTTLQSSDKILKFNVKSLVLALYVINIEIIVEYKEIDDLMSAYTSYTPYSQQNWQYMEYKIICFNCGLS